MNPKDPKIPADVVRRTLRSILDHMDAFPARPFRGDAATCSLGVPHAFGVCIFTQVGDSEWAMGACADPFCPRVRAPNCRRSLAVVRRCAHRSRSLKHWDGEPYQCREAAGHEGYHVFTSETVYQGGDPDGT